MHAPSPMLRICLFGPLSIEHDGRPLPRIATQKAVGLLAYLLTRADQPIAREFLAEQFWPDRPADNARRSLNTALWHIRHALAQGSLDPDDHIKTSATTVTWKAAPEAWSDVTAFEAACAADSATSLQLAISLYRGPFLDGLYDPWCIEERYRLEDTYLRALQRLGEWHRRSGDFPQALVCARRILQVDPLREDAQRMAMEALYQTDQRAAALAQYLECVKVLRAELQIEPSQETRELHAAIAAESLPRVTPPSPPEPSILAGHGQAAAAHPAFESNTAPFAGRGDELRRLQAWWRGEAAPLALITGEAGVGKTRLSRELATNLQWHGANVGWGRSYAFERALPYHCVAEALRGLLAASDDRLLQDIPDWAALELARLLPEFGERLRHKRSSAAAPDRSSLFEAVARTLALIAAQQPLLLVLDDLHWSSESTRDLLEYLVRRLPEMTASQTASDGQPLRVKLLATIRREELRPDEFHALVRRLRPEPSPVQLDLERLDRASVVDWIGRWSARGPESRAFAERVFDETEGNPFFMIELVKALFESGRLQSGPHGWEGAVFESTTTTLPVPPSVRELIQSRVARLPTASREALQVAAVSGREFDQSILQAAWGRTEEETLTALDDVLRAELVHEAAATTGRDYEFTHHKIQEVLYDDQPRARRAWLHRRLGETIQAAYGEKAAAELFHHFRAAGEASRAVEWGIKAGQQALRLFAYQDALRSLQQVQELLKVVGVAPDVEMALYAGLAEAYDDARAPDQTVSTAEHFLALARSTGATGREIEALLRLANGLGYANDPRTLEILTRARALAERAQDAHLPEILYRMGVSIGWPGQWDEALPLMEEALALGKRMGDPRTGARALNGMAIAWRAKMELGRSIAAFEEGIALNETIGQRRVLAAMLQNLGETYALLHVAGPAREYIMRSHELFVAMGMHFPEDLRLVGVVCQLNGELPDARDWIQRAYELCRRQHDNDSLHETYRSYCLLLIESGDFQPALTLAEEFAANPEMQGLARNPDPTFFRGLARLSLGLVREAEQDLVPAVQRWAALGGNLHLLWHGYAALGRLYAAQVRVAEARQAYARALDLVTSLSQSVVERPAIYEGFLSSPPVRAIRAGLAALP